MSLHQADLKARLSRFLERRQMPRRIEGKETAIADEMRALVSVLERSAPKSAEALQAWWPRFEAELGEIGTGLWPIEKEIREAAKKATSAMPRDSATTEEFDPPAVNARKMEAGEPVGECWLYGRQAVEMIRRRLVTEDVMRAYRSGAFLARRELHGEAAAQAWEIEAKERHEAAKAILRDREPARSTAPIPDKTAPTKGMAA